MIEFFPPSSSRSLDPRRSLRGVVSQRLLPRAGGGRTPAVEVMVSNAWIADLIRENRPDEIPDAIDAGEYYEMQTFAQSLIDLVLRGEVEREIAAANAATNRHDFLVALEAEKVKVEEDEEWLRRRRRQRRRRPRGSPRSATASASHAGRDPRTGYPRAPCLPITNL